MHLSDHLLLLDSLLLQHNKHLFRRHRFVVVRLGPSRLVFRNVKLYFGRGLINLLRWQFKLLFSDVLVRLDFICFQFTSFDDEHRYWNDYETNWCSADRVNNYLVRRDCLWGFCEIAYQWLSVVEWCCSIIVLICGSICILSSYWRGVCRLGLYNRRW